MEWEIMPPDTRADLRRLADRREIIIMIARHLSGVVVAANLPIRTDDISAPTISRSPPTAKLPVSSAAEE